jgi:hypothetical protein
VARLPVVGPVGRAASVGTLVLAPYSGYPKPRLDAKLTQTEHLLISWAKRECGLRLGIATGGVIFLAWKYHSKCGSAPEAETLKAYVRLYNGHCPQVIVETDCVQIVE